MGPQLENGFTPISNEILEAVSGASLNGTQLRILLLLWRNSYGFHRKECSLPLSYLEKMLKGSKSTIARQIRRLAEAGVINETTKKGDGHTPKIYSFNKNYKTWKCGAAPIEKNTESYSKKEAEVCGLKNREFAIPRTDKYINKYNFKNNFKKEKKSRYNYEEIERRAFLNVTKNANILRKEENTHE